MTRLYLVALVDLAVAVWLLWYARVRERRNRAGGAVVGMMLVGCAGLLVVLAVTHRTPPVRQPAPIPTSTGGTEQSV